MKRTTIWVLGLAVLLLTACGSPIETNMSRDVNSLEAINQDGEKVTLPEDYSGEYWIADFIFTSCETVCPPMTGNMSRLQQELDQEGMEVPLVSMSVDPKTDTPEKMKSFAEPYQPDFSQWNFLTGYSFQEVKEFSIKSFQSPVKQLENSNQVAHGTSFYLVTPEGEVIKSYNGTEAGSLDQIIEDLQTLKQNQ
ncbi:protein SCO1/2 [Halobacillus alkaliphilus]|uniref:Protein SCO1/2 n=1 Tax=Halobacillus alkaliphilus TaxID=396056 RepID=A0A1I2R5X4_9BACI|nr:SCO family protein [Halobacillus alkaliphilus]SFG35820.1 protein SCO1/2 [Halobacillus alkaliphilus]